MVTKLKIPKGYSAAVLHTHTNHTDGMLAPEKLVQVAAEAGVKVIAITDHDTFSPIKKAQQAGAEYGIEVIAGQEIQTSLPRGLHIVGLFLKKPIPHSKPIFWTIEKIREQGGIAVVAHPLVRLFNFVKAPTGAFQETDLKKLIQSCGVDAVEIRHRFLHEQDREKLDNLYYNNQKFLGAVIGASDCHFGQDDMFCYFTLFPGKTSGDFYCAIKERTTKIGYGPPSKINKLQSLAQMKKSLVDVGVRRYKKMLQRWVGLDFSSRYDFLNE